MLKHQTMIERILSELYEPWMDDDDIVQFNQQVLKLLGKTIDAEIEKGIENGYSQKQQEIIVRSILRKGEI